MKILYLAHRIPYPPNKGDKIRSCHQLRYLSKRHDVWCACFVDDPADLEHLTTLRQWCRNVVGIPLSPRAAALRGAGHLITGRSLTEGFYRSRPMSTVLQRWSQEIGFDAAMFFSSGVASYRPIVAARRSVLDFCDWDSLKWDAYAANAKPPRSLLYRLEARRLRTREDRWLNEFDASVVATEAERRSKPSASNHDRVHVVGNGAIIGPEPAHTSADAAATIGFVGEMSYKPNVDAVCWFADNVLPRVQRAVPQATFDIVGRRPAREVLRLGQRGGVHVTGLVDDVRSRIEQFAVSVAPLRIGQGIQNKVLEAMAASRPVVLSSTAAAGIDAVTGDHFVVADDAQAVSDRIVELLRNPHRRSVLGAAARKHIAKRYSWDRELAKLDAILAGTPADRRTD